MTSHLVPSRPKKPPSPVGERIAALLVERGMRARDLDRGIAARTGANAPDGWTHKVTNGMLQNPRGPHLEAAAAVLGVDVRHLLQGTGPELHRQLPGWEAAAADPTIPYAAWVVRAVADAPVMVAPEQVTAAYVAAACGFWLAVAPPETRARAAAEAELARREKISARTSKG